MLQRRETEREGASTGMQSGRKQRLVSCPPSEHPFTMRDVHNGLRILHGIT